MFVCPEFSPDKVCPYGSAGGGCRLQRLDLSYNKLADDTSYMLVQVRCAMHLLLPRAHCCCLVAALLQALRSWIRKIPASALSETAITKAFAELHAGAVSADGGESLVGAGDVLAALTSTKDDLRLYGTSSGLSQVCLAGTRMHVDDLSGVSALTSSVQSDIHAALDKVWL